MTRQRFNSKAHWRVLQSSLLAFAIASPLTLSLTPPAEAGLIDSVRRILSGDTGSRASGRSRGGATRDEMCTVGQRVPETADNPGASNSQLVVLIPDALQKTTQANPELFLYVPFGRNAQNMMLVFELATKETANSRQVIAGPITLSLPTEPGLMRFQLPSETPLEIGETYEWTFRLVCQETQPTPDPELTALLPVAATGNTPIDIHDIQIPSLNGSTDRLSRTTLPATTVRQEVFGNIQRVGADETAKLNAALIDSDSSTRYETYLDYDIWLDMVSALAAAGPSSDWADLLAAFDLGDIEDPTPYTLSPSF
ncbi:MAG: DUF928 domain-containing protein [Leptolyngbya sp. SIO1D8]|nr:DUF928 domain-containing protein [Leptolyngbya sp. SIO1D8]